MAVDEYSVLRSSTARRLIDLLQQYERDPVEKGNDLGREARVPIVFRNVSGHTIPAYGLMQAKTTYEDALGYIDVVRAYDYTYETLSIPLVNGPFEVADDGFGTAQTGPVFRVKHDGAIAYSTGDRIGWKTDNFEAQLGALFRIVGDEFVGTNIVKAVFDQSAQMGQSAAAISAGSSGNVYVRHASSGGFTTNTGKTYTAWNDTSVQIPNNVRIMLWPSEGRFIAIEVC